MALYLRKGQWGGHSWCPMYYFGIEDEEVWMIEENREEIRDETIRAVNDWNLSAEGKKKFKQLLLEFEGVFSREPKITPIMKHRIELKENILSCLN